MHHYGARLRSKRQNPKASISNAIVGTNTVAVYTKHQRLHEHEFAMHKVNFDDRLIAKLYETQLRLIQRAKDLK